MIQVSISPYEYKIPQYQSRQQHHNRNIPFNRIQEQHNQNCTTQNYRQDRKKSVNYYQSTNNRNGYRPNRLNFSRSNKFRDNNNRKIFYANDEHQNDEILMQNKNNIEILAKQNNKRENNDKNAGMTEIIATASKIEATNVEDKPKNTNEVEQICSSEIIDTKLNKIDTIYRENRWDDMNKFNLKSFKIPRLKKKNHTLISESQNSEKPDKSDIKLSEMEFCTFSIELKSIKYKICDKVLPNVPLVENKTNRKSIKRAKLVQSNHIIDRICDKTLSKIVKLSDIIKNIIPLNSDPNKWNNGTKLKHCVLCKATSHNIIAHYVEQHPNDEVYHSRMTPTMTNLIRNGIYSNAEKAFNKINAICMFCEKKLLFENESQWYFHIAEHTGEYPRDCIECKPSDKKCEHFEDELISGLSLIDKNLNIFICIKCNFCQLKKSNMFKHLSNTHKIEEKHEYAYDLCAIMKNICNMDDEQIMISIKSDLEFDQFNDIKPKVEHHDSMKLEWHNEIVINKPMEAVKSVDGGKKIEIVAENMAVSIVYNQNTYICHECYFECDHYGEFHHHILQHNIPWNGHCAECKTTLNCRPTLIDELFHLREYHLKQFIIANQCN